MSPRLLDLVLQGLTLAAWLCLPVVAAGLLASIVAGLIGRLTAWQEPVISYACRLCAVGLAWSVTAAWVADELVSFVRLAWGG